MMAHAQRGPSPVAGLAIPRQDGVPRRWIKSDRYLAQTMRMSSFECNRARSIPDFASSELDDSSQEETESIPPIKASTRAAPPIAPLPKVEAAQASAFPSTPPSQPGSTPLPLPSPTPPILPSPFPPNTQYATFIVPLPPQTNQLPWYMPPFSQLASSFQSTFLDAISRYPHIQPHTNLLVDSNPTVNPYALSYKPPLPGHLLLPPTSSLDVLCRTAVATLNESAALLNMHNVDSVDTNALHVPFDSNHDRWSNRQVQWNPQAPNPTPEERGGMHEYFPNHYTQSESRRELPSYSRRKSSKLAPSRWDDAPSSTHFDREPQRVHSRHESSSLRGHVPDHRASIPPPKPLLHSKTAPNLETTLPTRSYDRIDPLCAAVAARIAEILEPEGETVPDEPLPVIEPVNRDQPQFRRRFRSRSSRDAALIAERRAEEVPVPPVHQVEQSKTNETEPAKANHLGFPLLPPLPKKHDHDDCIDHLPAEVSSPPTLQTLSASPTPPTSKTLAPSPPEHFRKPPLPYTPYATELNKPPRATDHTAEILISDSSIGSGAAEDARASHVDDKAHERSSAQEDSVSSCQPEATLAEWPRIGDKAHETPSDRQEGLLSHQPEGMSGEAPPIGDQPRSSGIQVQGSDRDWEQEFKTRESSMRTKLHTAETEVDQARQRQELAESALRDGKQEWETRERDWVAKVGKANRETEDAMNKLEHAEKKEKELEQLLAEATKRTELAEKKAQEAQDEVQNVTASASNLAATHMKAIETAEAAHAAALAAANRDFNERMVKADRRAEIAEARVGDAERRVAEAVHEVEKAQEAEAAMKKKATDVENTLLEVEVKTREKRILLKEMDAKVKDLTKKLEQESGGRKLAEVRAAVAEAAIERRDIALSSLAAASQKRYLELTTVWMQLVELTDNLVYAEQYIEWLQNAGKNGSTRMSMPAMADPGIYGGTKRSLNGLSMDSRASATTSRGSVVSSLMSEQDSGRSATGTASHIVPVNSENEAGEGGDAIFAAQRGTTSERETKSTISRMSSTSERERERAAADAAPLPTSLFTVPSSEFSEGKSSRSDGTQSQLEISASHGSVRGSQKWALPSNLARMGSGTPSMSDIKAVSGRFLEMRKKDAKRPANNMQSNDSVNVMLSNTSIKVVDFRTKQ